MQDRGFNSFAFNMIKLSVNETKWSSLLARTRALILCILIWKFDFGPEKLPGLSRNGPQARSQVFFYGRCDPRRRLTKRDRRSKSLGCQKWIRDPPFVIDCLTENSKARIPNLWNGTVNASSLERFATKRKQTVKVMFLPGKQLPRQ